ncbi:hypothetical protein BV25DRAFT_1917791 [Artomyces pyxidatus]|uniref:Uncharacterized protein n=1 Tax=Artomyces pyxidatus TaxID=48021 RepID=A0ACB8SX08_9AGAM|nr:hypothetical protein BV25DRAFT_1917791 [Artomyces pyxidatus]
MQFFTTLVALVFATVALAAPAPAPDAAALLEREPAPQGGTGCGIHCAPLWKA